MDTRKLHYLINFLSYPILILYFILIGYSYEVFLSGIIFFSVASIVYFGFVYLFFKSEAGKKIVGWSLILMAIFSAFQIFSVG